MREVLEFPKLSVCRSVWDTLEQFMGYGKTLKSRQDQSSSSKNKPHIKKQEWRDLHKDPRA